MAHYIGTAYATILKVDKTNGTTSYPNYPKEYNLVLSTVTDSTDTTTSITVPAAGGGTQPVLTEEQYQAQSQAEHDSRVADFVSYIEGEESGYDHSTSCDNLSTKSDASCLGAVPE